MSNIGRLSMVNNKIDAIDSLEITANNRLKQLHFIGNHLLDLPPTRSFRIQGNNKLRTAATSAKRLKV